MNNSRKHGFKRVVCMEDLVRLQDMIYKLEEEFDELAEAKQDLKLHNEIMDKAKEIGI